MAGRWLVELAGLSAGAMVAPAVEAVLDVESRSTRSSEQAIAVHVGLGRFRGRVGFVPGVLSWSAAVARSVCRVVAQLMKNCW
jgi:hypothetical protein